MAGPPAHDVGPRRTGTILARLGGPPDIHFDGYSGPLWPNEARAQIPGLPPLPPSVTLGRLGGFLINALYEVALSCPVPFRRTLSSCVPSRGGRPERATTMERTADTHTPKAGTIDRSCT